MGIEIKHTCSRSHEDFLKVSNNGIDVIIVEGEYNGLIVDFYLDISTAIKFSKTIRTEINKIKGGKNV